MGHDSVAPISVNTPVSVNVDNNGRYLPVTVNAFTITVRLSKR